MSSDVCAQTFITESAEATRRFAEILGRALLPGDLLCLIGDLGAGKTTFTQGLALGLGLPAEEPINSPTFTLIAEHPGGRIPLYHLDVYRLPDSSALNDLGLDDYWDGDAVVVIEWADKITDALPPDRLEISLRIGEDRDQRQITLVAFGSRAREIADRISAL